MRSLFAKYEKCAFQRLMSRKLFYCLLLRLLSILLFVLCVNGQEVTNDVNQGDSSQKILDALSANVDSKIECKSATEDVSKDTSSSCQSSTVPVPTEEINEKAPVDEARAMPSFDEWKKKMIAEADSKELLAAKGAIRSGSIAANPTVKGSQSRVRNYASNECGAKVVAANSEAEGTSRILNEQLDEYMLNPCKAKIWFVVELCEVVQPVSIELANFELFSSSPKEFTVYASERYPSREWDLLASFNATDARSLQNFEFAPQTEFRKYIKVEMISFHGSEHYCPLSVIHVYGISMVEQFDAIERADESRKGEQIDDESLDSGISEESLDLQKSVPGSNLLGTAKEAVFHLVRKAALVLGTKNTPSDALDSNEFHTFNRYIVFFKNLSPALESKLKHCTAGVQISGLINSPPVSIYENSSLCRFFESVFGKSAFEFICMELQKEHLMRFKSDPTRFSNISTCEPPSKIEEKKIEVKLEIPNSTENVLKPVTSAAEESINVTTTEELNSTMSESHSDLDKSDTKNVINDPVANNSAPVIDANETKTEDTSTNASATAEFLAFLNESETSNEKNSSVPTQSQQVPLNGVNSIPLSGSQSKESIFIRMNNRIKSLEVNLSLTNQYLEELSLRYRRQMDNMYTNFNKTITKLNETATKAEEKDIRQQDKLNQLQIKLNEMDEKVSLLVTEKETLHWQFIEVHILLLFAEILIMITISSLFVRRVSTKVNEIIETSKLLHSNSRYTQTATKRFLLDDNNDRENHSPAKSKRLDDLVIFEPSIAIMVDAPTKNKKRKKRKQMATMSNDSHKNSDPLLQNSKPAVNKASLQKSNSVSSFPVKRDLNSEFQLGNGRRDSSSSVVGILKHRHLSSNSGRLSSASLQATQHPSNVGFSGKSTSKSSLSSSLSCIFNWRRFIRFDRSK